MTPTLLWAIAACTALPGPGPVADAGSDQRAQVGERVSLSGAAYPSEEVPIAGWWWSVLLAPSGSSAGPSPADEPEAALLPDLPGFYSLGLRVIDAYGRLSETSALNVEVWAEDLSPVAELRAEEGWSEGPVLLLNGQGSYDPEGEVLFYTWSLEVAPEGSWAGIELGEEPDSARLQADQPGIYAVGLEVSDGRLSSRRADVSWVVEE